jgi:hypothetical protein
MDDLYKYKKYVATTDSLYQSKRAKLTKQVTHWMGKFAIVKGENNRLRQMMKTITASNIRMVAMAGELDKEVAELKDCLAEARLRFNEQEKALDHHRSEEAKNGILVSKLEKQVQELEAGALV